MKALVAGRLGYAAVDGSKVKNKAGVEVAEYFREGVRLEEVVLERLRALGWVITDQQLELDIPVMRGIILQGHIDGFVDNVRLLEVKSMRPQSFEAVLEKGWDAPGLLQKYKWQLSVYLIGLRERQRNPLIEGVVAIIDSDPDIQDDDERRLTFLHFEQPFHPRPEILGRVLTAEAWVKRGEVPVDCDARMFPCPFFYLEEDEEVELLDDPEVQALGRAVLLAERDKKEADARWRASRSALLEGMGDRERVDVEGLSVVRWEQKNPSSWDTERMRADGVDLEKYRVQGKSWRMRVTERDDSAAASDVP